ncbi:MAG: hypothetical protein QM765_10695 [Myxococcales bacterium]
MPRPLGFLPHPLPTAFLVAMLLALASCKPAAAEVAVFHDQGLSPLLSDLVPVARREQPALRARLEPSEGALAVRKLTELSLKADLVVSCDAAALEDLLSSKKVSWLLTFATDEVVLAHKDHSRFTDEISASNWTDSWPAPK